MHEMLGRRRAFQQEEFLLAVCAAEWLDRLKAERREVHVEFLRWVKQSPLHVREVLLAITCDAELNRIDPDRKIDIAELLERMDTDVVPIQPDGVLAKGRTPYGWARWFRIISIGILTAVLVFVGWSVGKASLL